MAYEVISFANHLLLHNVRIINTHYGDSFCFVIKHSDPEYLKLLTNQFPNVILIDVLSSISNGYQYLFVRENVDL